MANRKLIIGCNAAGSGGVDITSYLISFKVGYEKLWSSDTGRNMNGDNQGTLVGIFPKLYAKCGRIRTTPAVARQILGIINQATFYAKYYDYERQSMVVINAYANTAEATAIPSSSEDLLEIEEFHVISNNKRR